MVSRLRRLQAQYRCLLCGSHLSQLFTDFLYISPSLSAYAVHAREAHRSAASLCLFLKFHLELVTATMRGKFVVASWGTFLNVCQQSACQQNVELAFIVVHHHSSHLHVSISLPLYRIAGANVLAQADLSSFFQINSLSRKCI